MSKLYQYSHFLAVTYGAYDGELSISELKKQGNFGLGTFNGIDGELVAINNTFYHCSAGKVKLAKDNQLLSWAAVASFEPSFSHEILNMADFKQLESHIKNQTGSLNFPQLIFIKGHCENITLGSVPKQTKPYRPPTFIFIPLRILSLSFHKMSFIKICY